MLASILPQSTKGGAVIFIPLHPGPQTISNPKTHPEAQQPQPSFFPTTEAIEASLVAVMSQDISPHAGVCGTIPEEPKRVPFQVLPESAVNDEDLYTYANYRGAKSEESQEEKP